VQHLRACRRCYSSTSGGTTGGATAVLHEVLEEILQQALQEVLEEVLQQVLQEVLEEVLQEVLHEVLQAVLVLDAVQLFYNRTEQLSSVLGSQIITTPSQSVTGSHKSNRPQKLRIPLTGVCYCAEQSKCAQNPRTQFRN
jgi:hypothetical protein